MAKLTIEDKAYLKAAKSGDLEGVVVGLAHGVDINVVDSKGMSALSWAFKNGNIDIIDHLIKCGSKIFPGRHESDKRARFSPFDIAFEFFRPEYAGIFNSITMPENPRFSFDKGLIKPTNPSLLGVRYLLDRDRQSGYAPYTVAGILSYVTCLISPDTNIENFNDLLKFHISTYGAKGLSDLGGPKSIRLHALDNNASVLALVMDAVRQYVGASALSKAFLSAIVRPLNKRLITGVLEVLCDQFSKLSDDEKAVFSNTSATNGLITGLARIGDVNAMSMIGQYLTPGVDLKKGWSNRNLLMIALEYGRCDMAHHLDQVYPEMRDEVSREGTGGLRVLEYAIKGGVENIPYIDYLIDDHGADIVKPSKVGAPPMHTAVKRGDVDMVSYLISRGAPVEYPGLRDVHQPLIAAGMGNKEELVHLLLDHGADPAIQSRGSKTIVHVLSKGKCNTVLARLIEDDFSFKETDQKGKSYLDKLMDSGNENVISAFEQIKVSQAFVSDADDSCEDDFFL